MEDARDSTQAFEFTNIMNLQTHSILDCQSQHPGIIDVEKACMISGTPIVKVSLKLLRALER